MKNNETPMESLYVQIENYSQTKLQLLRLQSIDLAADFLSTIISALMIVVVVSLFIFIINIAMALWIGVLLGNAYYGFFVVAGFYAIVAVCFYIFRCRLIKYPLNDIIIIWLQKIRKTES
jgi:hypothetical protein